MEAAIPLYTRMERAIQKFDLADIEWRMTIHDHKDLIKEKSTLVALTPELIQKYLYRPDEFLIEYQKKPKGLSWIMLFINDLSSKMEFNMSLNYILVPDVEYINGMYSTYHSILAARKKNL